MQDRNRWTRTVRFDCPDKHNEIAVVGWEADARVLPIVKAYDNTPWRHRQRREPKPCVLSTDETRIL